MCFLITFYPFLFLCLLSHIPRYYFHFILKELPYCFIMKLKIYLAKIFMHKIVAILYFFKMKDVH